MSYAYPHVRFNHPTTVVISSTRRFPPSVLACDKRAGHSYQSNMARNRRDFLCSSLLLRLQYSQRSQRSSVEGAWEYIRRYFVEIHRVWSACLERCIVSLKIQMTIVAVSVMFPAFLRVHLSHCLSPSPYQSIRAEQILDRFARQTQTVFTTTKTFNIFWSNVHYERRVYWIA